jgi:1-acyl-sn-glycerol-3-phosphate acyltransferase
MLEGTLVRFGRAVVDLYARLMLQMDLRWYATLPVGPKILAANHPATTDPFLILLLVQEPVGVLVTAGAFTIPGFGRYLRAAGHLPAHRHSGGATVEAVRRQVEAGRSVAIFPEGAISPPDGGFHRPHTGLARVALATGAPVVPVGIGLDRARIKRFEAELDGKPEVVTWYLNGPYALTVGRPLRFEGDSQDRARVRSVSDQIMQRIAGLARESDLRLAGTPALEPQRQPGSVRLPSTSPAK